MQENPFGCENVNGRCANPSHARAKIGKTGVCTKATGWLPNAKQCPGCGAMVAIHQGWRMAPQVFAEFAANNIVSPMIPVQMMTFHLKMVVPGAYWCNGCKEEWINLLVNGVLRRKVGAPMDPALTGETFNRLVETERREAARKKAEAEQAARTLAQAEARKIAEEKAVEKRASDFRLNLVRQIKAGETRGIGHFPMKVVDGMKLMSCSMIANGPKFCLCENGGWQDWERMPAVICRDGRKAFGFGPGCAAAIVEAMGQDPFDCQLPLAVAACKSGDAKKFLADRAAPTFSNRSDHSHQYGANVRPPRVVKTPPPLPPEEQRRRQQEAELDRRLRHDEGLKAAARFAADLKAGAMAQEPNGKKADSKGGKKPKKSGGRPGKADRKFAQSQANAK